MKLGDSVSWTSQAGGRWTTKAGQVVEVVEPGSVPRSKIRGAGHSRLHQSYVVNVNGVLYWPRTPQLKPVEGTVSVDVQSEMRAD